MVGSPSAALRGGRYDTLLFDPGAKPVDDELAPRMLGYLALAPGLAARVAIKRFLPTASEIEAIATLADGLLPEEGPKVFDAISQGDEITDLQKELIQGCRLTERLGVAHARATLRPFVLQAETMALNALGPRTPPIGAR